MIVANMENVCTYTILIHHKITSPDHFKITLAYFSYYFMPVTRYHVLYAYTKSMYTTTQLRSNTHTHDASLKPSAVRKKTRSFALALPLLTEKTEANQQRAIRIHATERDISQAKEWTNE